MRSVVRFERRVDAVDADGSPLGGWQSVGEAHGTFRPQYGSERLAAGAITNTARGNLAVNATPLSRSLTGAERVVFLAGAFAGKSARIISMPIETADRRSVECLLEFGTPQ